MLDNEIPAQGANREPDDMRTAPNWMLGNSVETEQWESGNANVAFPFADDVLPSGFPKDIIVDALVVVPREDGKRQEVSVGSVHVGPSLVSAFILVDGHPALYCSVLKDVYEPFSPVVMTSVMRGVSGMIAFGAVDFGEKATWRLNARLSDTAVVRPDVGRLEKFVDPETGAEASGVVRFDLPKGVSVSIEEAGHSSSVRFSADSSIRNIVPLPCSEMDSPKTMTVPVRNINGIVPDSLGRIAIVFMHDESEIRRVEEL